MIDHSARWRWSAVSISVGSLCGKKLCTHQHICLLSSCHPYRGLEFWQWVYEMFLSSIIMKVYLSGFGHVFSFPWNDGLKLNYKKYVRRRYLI
jgi:hypothetical protein